MEDFKSIFDTVVVGFLALPWLAILAIMLHEGFMCLCQSIDAREKKVFADFSHRLKGYCLTFKDNALISGALFSAFAFIMGTVLFYPADEMFDEEQKFFNWTVIRSDDSLKVQTYYKSFIKYRNDWRNVSKTKHSQIFPWESEKIEEAEDVRSHLSVEPQSYYSFSKKDNGDEEKRKEKLWWQFLKVTEKQITSATSGEKTKKNIEENIENAVAGIYTRHKYKAMLNEQVATELDALRNQIVILRGASLNGLLTFLFGALYIVPVWIMYKRQGHLGHIILSALAGGIIFKAAGHPFKLADHFSMDWLVAVYIVACVGFCLWTAFSRKLIAVPKAFSLLGGTFVALLLLETLRLMSIGKWGEKPPFPDTNPASPFDFFGSKPTQSIYLDYCLIATLITGALLIVRTYNQRKTSATEDSDSKPLLLRQRFVAITVATCVGLVLFGIGSFGEMKAELEYDKTVLRFYQAIEEGASNEDKDSDTAKFSLEIPVEKSAD